MHRIILGFGFVVAALVAAGAAAKDEKAAKRATKEQVHELMKKTHRGEKSPLALAKAELQKESPDWKQLAEDAKAFAEMSEALKSGASPYTNPEGYVTRSVAFGKAVGEKDANKASAAFTGLTQSCSACHYGIPK